MKKIKLLALVMALLLSATVLLTACGNDAGTTVADIMNPEYVEEEEGILSSGTKLSLTGDYKTAKGNFVVTTESHKSSDSSSASTTTRVYNIETAKSVVSFTSSSSPSSYSYYYVDIISEDYFAVLSRKGSSSSSSSSTYSVKSAIFDTTLVFGDNYSNTLTIYDKNGDDVETIDNSTILSLCKTNGGSFDIPYKTSDFDAIIDEYRGISGYKAMTNNDLVVIGTEVYRIEDDEMTLVEDFGLLKKPYDIMGMEKVGEYYLGYSAPLPDISDVDKFLEEGTITQEVYDAAMADYANALKHRAVYDSDLNKVYEYAIPEYAIAVGGVTENDYTVALLANGKLLVQYGVQLDQNETKFDYRSDADGKYDLVTVLVDEKGVKNINADYVFGAIRASVEDEDGQKIYAEKIENLAFVYPIDDNDMIDMSDANRDLALLSNKGKVTDTVAINGDVAEYFPIHFLDDYYLVYLADGSCIIYDKESGETVSELAEMGSVLAGEYIYSNKAIYDLYGEKVEDLKLNSATVCGESLVLSRAGVKSTSYSIFVEGEISSIGTVYSTSDSSGYSNVGVASDYYYTVKRYSENDYTYTYYNEKGENLVSASCSLSAVLRNETYVLMVGTDSVETMGDNGLKTIEKVSVFYRIDIE